MNGGTVAPLGWRNVCYGLDPQSPERGVVRAMSGRGGPSFTVMGFDDPRFRQDMEKGVTNTIVTSFNRNFARRADGNPDTLAFIGGPELVTALAFGGKLSFNPLTDGIELPDGLPGLRKGRP